MISMSRRTESFVSPGKPMMYPAQMKMISMKTSVKRTKKIILTASVAMTIP